MRNLINRLFNRGLDSEEIERRDILRAWERELSRATSRNQRAEIDAIFARHL
jgi:hypothetical protein